MEKDKKILYLIDNRGLELDTMKVTWKAKSKYENLNLNLKKYGLSLQDEYIDEYY